MYKVIIYSKKTIFIQLLNKFIKEIFLESEKDNECGKITVIENMQDLKQINSVLTDEYCIILLDCSIKEEIEYLEEMIKEEIEKNHKIYAHVILLNDIYNNSHEKIYLFHNIYLSDNINDLIRIIQNIIFDEQKEQSDNKEILTKRETEILILIARGMLNKEIANELNITERTVKNHISNIFKKINVYDRTQAAVYAIKNKIYNI